MKKVTTYYSDEQLEQLKVLSELTGEKISSKLHRAVEMYLDHARSRGLLVDPKLLEDEQDEDEFSAVPDVVIEAV
ncbi:hypothetical protein KFU94_41675 [Chloroflexi bacterium TSY]|nr:hypothetical protein [Chloroflexi bacterium TSY]